MVCNLLMDDLSIEQNLQKIQSLGKETQTFFQTLISSSHEWGQAEMCLLVYKYRIVMDELKFRTLFNKFNKISNSAPPGTAIVPTETGAITPLSFGSAKEDGSILNSSPINSIKKACDRVGVDGADFMSGVCGVLTVQRDSTILSNLCTALGGDVETVVKLFRNQVENDSRPNKCLDASRYRRMIPSFSELDDMCLIAEKGFTPRAPLQNGIRPLPKNYTSAIDRSPAMLKRLTSDFYSGRTLMISSVVATNDPAVNTSPLGMVPKNGLPSDDGLFIHDLSAPIGSSINESVPLKKLNASTDAVTAIGIRILACYYDFPGTPIVGLTADVDSAFQNIPTSSSGTLLFGGKVPKMDLVAISLAATFGFKDSPGLFGIFMRALKFYFVSGVSEIFGSFQAFWCWIWVDDVVLIEPMQCVHLRNIEQRLRNSFVFIFGSKSWNDDKFHSWRSAMHAVGLDWDLAAGTVSMPPEKLLKAIVKVDEMIARFDVVFGDKPSLKQWRSLVGTLRHVSTCVPIASGFFQHLVSIEKDLIFKREIDSETILLDLKWFKALLQTDRFNGVSLFVFTRTVKTNYYIYVGWDKAQAYLIDFDEKKSYLVEGGNIKGAAILLNWYFLVFKITSARTKASKSTHPAGIHVFCQTDELAKRLRSFTVDGVSLRFVAWLCVLNNVALFTYSSKSLFNLTTLCVMKQGVLESTKEMNLLLPSAKTYKPFTMGALQLPLKLPILLNWNRGFYFADWQKLTSPQFVFSNTKFRMTCSHCSRHSRLPAVSEEIRWVTGHLRRQECPRLSDITPIDINKSSLDQGFGWRLLGSSVLVRLTKFRPKYPLILPYSARSGNICYTQLAEESGKLFGGAVCLHSLGLCGRVKSSRPVTIETD